MIEFDFAIEAGRDMQHITPSDADRDDIYIDDKNIAAKRRGMQAYFRSITAFRRWLPRLAVPPAEETAPLFITLDFA